MANSSICASVQVDGGGALTVPDDEPEGTDTFVRPVVPDDDATQLIRELRMHASCVRR